MRKKWAEVGGEGMKFTKKALRLILAAAVLAGFLLYQNFSIQTQSCKAGLTRLPQGFDGFRVLQLSDLHGRRFGDHSCRLLQAAREAQPHIICITGDLFDEHTELSMLWPLLKGLTAIAPTFYVTGNHEWQVPGLQELLSSMEALGVHVLANEYTFFERGGDQIVIAGVHDPCGPYDQKSPKELMEEIRKAAGEGAFVLMLAHRNDSLDLWAELGADLVLTGHCHGGVIRLPLVGGVFGSERRFFPEYDAGLYGKGRTLLYVSRGLGYSNVSFRLFNRPQLPLLVLNRK